MFKTVLKILAFGLICFGVVEQSYRVYVAGPVAFNPQHFNRMNQLLLTDLVEHAQHPDIYYQLKPNLREWFRGAELRTNSIGLADQEYMLQKPPGTRRVAVIGSSWTMGTGVAPEESYHAVLESMLNDTAGEGRHYEILNFGVEMYGLGEMLGTLRHRVPDWQPDMVVAAVTTYTPTLLWEERSALPPMPEPTNPFFQPYTLRALDHKLGLGLFKSAGTTRRTVSDPELYRAQILRAIKEIGEHSRAAGIPAMLLWLSFAAPEPEFEVQIKATAAMYDVRYVPAYEWIRGEQDLLLGRRVSRMDNHPNAASHKLLATGLYAELKTHKLVTGVE